MWYRNCDIDVVCLELDWEVSWEVSWEISWEGFSFDQYSNYILEMQLEYSDNISQKALKTELWDLSQSIELINLKHRNLINLAAESASGTL